VALGAAPDQIAALARTLESDPSEKARIAAAVALGKRGDPRALAPFIRALSDPSPIVRGLSASALGHLGDTRAVPALERALADESDSVRARARDALELLRPPAPAPVQLSATVPTRARITPKEAPIHGKLHVMVKAMGVKAQAAHHLTGRMRELVVAQLAAAPDVSIDGEGDSSHQFIVDGSIVRLSRELNGPWVEVTCEVKITVSNAQGSILSIVSGGATVQTSRGAMSRAAESGLETEALDNAVRGAHQNLYSFLLRQGGGPAGPGAQQRGR
jgi:hypothetical protein